MKRKTLFFAFCLGLFSLTIEAQVSLSSQNRALQLLDRGKAAFACGNYVQCSDLLEAFERIVPADAPERETAAYMLAVSAYERELPDALSRMIHLLIRLGDVFGVGRMNSHNALLFEEAVKAGNGSGIPSLSKLNPENHKARMGIAPSHMGDELDFFRSMLVRMMMGTPGAVAKGFQRAVIAAFPAVNILSIGFVLNSSLRDTMLFSVAN